MNDFLSRLEMTSEMAGSRHLMFANALLNAAQGAMTGPLAFSAAGARQLKSGLVDLGWTYLESEGEAMTVALDDIARDAHTVASQHLGHTDPQTSFDALSARFSQSHDASHAYLNGEVVSQTNRDVNQVLRDYQNTSLRVLMTADAKRIPMAAAAMQIMLDEISNRRKLWFQDRVGRKIPSQKHIRRTWRMILRDHWLMVYAQTMTAHGVTRALIWHPEPSHTAFGIEVDLTDADFGLANRDEIFHPNARALLATPNALEAA